MDTIKKKPEDRFQRVAQKDVWGCGAACVASLLGASYAEALRLLQHFKRGTVGEEPEGFEIDEIARALYSEGVKVIADWNPACAPPIGSILCIHNDGKYKDFHYLLVTPNGLMDPCPGLRKGTEAAFTQDLPANTRTYVALIPA